MSNQRVGGIIFLKVDGDQRKAKGNFTYNLGVPKRKEVMGADAFHGFTETPQPAFIEGELTDEAGLDLAAFLSFTDATVTLELANGKVVVLADAFNASDGDVKTEEGNIAFKAIGKSAQEIAAS